jgi:hypothetical protein
MGQPPGGFLAAERSFQASGDPDLQMKSNSAALGRAKWPIRAQRVDLISNAVVAAPMSVPVAEV